MREREKSKKRLRIARAPCRAINCWSVELCIEQVEYVELLNCWTVGLLDCWNIELQRTIEQVEYVELWNCSTYFKNLGSFIKQASCATAKYLVTIFIFVYNIFANMQISSEANFWTVGLLDCGTIEQVEYVALQNCSTYFISLASFKNRPVMPLQNIC